MLIYQTPHQNDIYVIPYHPGQETPPDFLSMRRIDPAHKDLKEDDLKEGNLKKGKSALASAIFHHLPGSYYNPFLIIDNAAPSSNIENSISDNTELNSLSQTSISCSHISRVSQKYYGWSCAVKQARSWRRGHSMISGLMKHQENIILMTHPYVWDQSLDHRSIDIEYDRASPWLFIKLNQARLKIKKTWRGYQLLFVVSTKDVVSSWGSWSTSDSTPSPSSLVLSSTIITPYTSRMLGQWCFEEEPLLGYLLSLFSPLSVYNLSVPKNDIKSWSSVWTDASATETIWLEINPQSENVLNIMRGFDF